jgi:hypothetical protein
VKVPRESGAAQRLGWHGTKDKLLNLIASQEQIEEITGYRKPTKQLDRLRRDGVKCMCNAKGKVVVFTSELIRVYCSTKSVQAIEEPDFSWAEKGSRSH